MKQSISREKVAAALKQEELGVPLEDIIRELGVTRETYLGWRRKYNAAAWAKPAFDNAAKTPQSEKNDE
jgi:putative transposase